MLSENKHNYIWKTQLLLGAANIVGHSRDMSGERRTEMITHFCDGLQ